MERLQDPNFDGDMITVDCDVGDPAAMTADERENLCYRERKKQELSPASREQLRLSINSRERERMHDINSAMDALRQVMPYGQGPSVKKISKMNTLLLARNYILLLNRSNDEMKKFLATAAYQPKVPAVGPVDPRLLCTPPRLGHHPLPTVHDVSSAFHGTAAVCAHLSRGAGVPCECVYCRRLAEASWQQRL